MSVLYRGSPFTRWLCHLIGHRWGDWGDDDGRMCRRCWRIEAFR